MKQKYIYHKQTHLYYEPKTLKSITLNNNYICMQLISNFAT